MQAQRQGCGLRPTLGPPVPSTQPQVRTAALPTHASPASAHTPALLTPSGLGPFCHRAGFLFKNSETDEQKPNSLIVKKHSRPPAALRSSDGPASVPAGSLCALTSKGARQMPCAHAGGCADILPSLLEEPQIWTLPQLKSNATTASCPLPSRRCCPSRSIRWPLGP